MFVAWDVVMMLAGNRFVGGRGCRRGACVRSVAAGCGCGWHAVLDGMVAGFAVETCTGRFFFGAGASVTCYAW